MREIEGIITHGGEYEDDMGTEYPVREATFCSEWGFQPLTLNHSHDDEKRMCEALRRCFGGDV